MSESIPPLDPGVLGALREVKPAMATVRRRARERLLRAVDGGRRGAEAGGAGWGGPATARMPRGIAFLLGGVVGVGVYSAVVSAVAPRIVSVDRAVAPVPPTASAVAPATSAGVALIANDLPLAPVTTAVASIGGDPRVGSKRGSQLSAERILLDEARAALMQGDPVRALDRLDRHRRSFSHPVLAEERDAMWVQALVKVGRYDDARARASTFRKRSPDSLFSSVVDSAIASIP